MLPVDTGLAALRGRAAQQGADIREIGMGYPFEQFLTNVSAQNDQLRQGELDPSDPRVIGRSPALAGLSALARSR